MRYFTVRYYKIPNLVLHEVHLFLAVDPLLLNYETSFGLKITSDSSRKQDTGGRSDIFLLIHIIASYLLLVDSFTKEFFLFKLHTIEVKSIQSGFWYKFSFIRHSPLNVVIKDKFYKSPSNIIYFNTSITFF